MPYLATCLWYDGAAEEAGTLYTSLIPDSAITATHRPTPDAPAVLVQVALAGVPFTLMNGGPGVAHGPAASIVVATGSQGETDAVWQGHLDAGSTPLRCGWLTDRFGVSWQVFPKDMQTYLFDGAPDARSRAHKAMLGMEKIDLAVLRAAHNAGE
jgi:2-polyprenyl-6-hydroxyphenyl methylase/3-demethylubiquinone-9 3-methyltransferase